jgi:hypothetical protein
MSPTFITSIFSSAPHDASSPAADSRALLYIILTTGGVSVNNIAYLHGCLTFRVWRLPSVHNISDCPSTDSVPILVIATSFYTWPTPRRPDTGPVWKYYWRRSWHPPATMGQTIWTCCARRRPNWHREVDLHQTRCATQNPRQRLGWIPQGAYI